MSTVAMTQLGADAGHDPSVICVLRNHQESTSILAPLDLTRLKTDRLLFHGTYHQRFSGIRSPDSKPSAITNITVRSILKPAVSIHMVKKPCAICLVVVFADCVALHCAWVTTIRTEPFSGSTMIDTNRDKAASSFATTCQSPRQLSGIRCDRWHVSERGMISESMRFLRATFRPRKVQVTNGKAQ